MPQVKSVKSLTEICINLILENQEFFCERFPIGELKDDVDALDSDKSAVNPFDELPNELLQELMRLLRDKESSYVLDSDEYPYFGHTYKTTPFLKLLITSRLRTLDLKLIKYGSDMSDILRLATIKSPYLETLQLDPTSHQYVTSYSFIPNFRKLRILAISFPDTGDDCFELIGSHCPDLRELKLSPGKHFQVTDVGIRKLCVDGICKSIHLLDLSRCSKVTTKGIQMALDNLPQLRVLRHKSLLECLAEIAQTAIEQNSTLPKYSLSTLEICYDSVFKSGYLQKCVQLCPNVTRVFLELMRRDRFEETNLLSSLALEKLYSISISYAEYEYDLNATEVRVDRGLTFDSVVHLLKKFGWCLKSLCVRDFFVVDIAAIIKFCPNLETLEIKNCKTSHSTETKLEGEESTILQNLKTLSIWRYSTISSEKLIALLSSPSLSCISILKCDALTDNILQTAVNLNSFRNLEYLKLTHCQSITKKGIDIFMQESNPLRHIELSITDAISREDINEWNDNAIWIRKNWRLIFYLGYRNICVGGNRNFWDAFS